MPGSGKSLLCAIIGLLAGQKQIVLADDDAELEKRISAVFTAEAGTVIFDNLPEGTTISSPILANLLTNPVWSGRILGSTRTGSWPNDRLWLATGNNLAVGGDMARRSVYVRLEPRAPHPEERTGFAIPDLPQRILDPALRSEILWHLLVLVLDWTHHGSPRDETAPNLGGYAPWTHGIAGFLAHHRIEGFLGNLAATRAEDTDDERWAAFLATWYRKYATTPIKAVDLFRDAQPSDLGYGQPVDPWDGTFITVRDRPPRSSDQLGVWLRGHIGRFHGDYVLRRDRDPHTKASYWRVELAQNTSEPSATLRNPPHEGLDLQ
jgi:hypothetical protein